MAAPTPKIDSFDFYPGRILAGKYVVEVYRVVEQRTGVRRAAKVFYPQRNTRDRALKYYATKLDRLRKCHIVIQYHHSVPIRYHGLEVTCLISELVEGDLLSKFINRQLGKRLHPFEAFHLLYALTAGLEQIHRVKEYHGDLHDDNILVQRRGIGFEVKLVNFYHWGPASRENRREDIINAIRLFYDAIGGRRRYRAQSPEVRAICCGLRRDLITRKFPTVTHLREYLESFDW